MEKCVIYSRVSTQHQSYESQITTLKKFAKDTNRKVVKVFAEKVSGYKEGLDREEYDLMKEFVITNDVKLILIWEISRLSRRMKTLVDEIDFYSRHNVNIFAYQGSISTLVDGKQNYLIVGVLGAMAQMERDNMTERVKRGVRESAIKGKRAGMGILPYGYTTHNSYLVVDKEEAKTVKLIFDMYEKGITQRKIAIHLNSLNIPTRNSIILRRTINIEGLPTKPTWKPHTVNGIARNPIYKGDRRFRGEIIQAPSIIEVEQWERVQKIMDAKMGHYSKTTKYPYLLRGKMQCGMCGRSFNSVTRKRGTVASSSYFCHGKSDVTIRCKCASIKTDNFDERVYSLLLQHKDLLLKLREETIHNFNLQEKEGQIVFYNGELSELEKRSKRIISLFKDGIIDRKEFDKDINSISLKKNEIELDLQKVVDEIENFNDLTKNKETKKDVIDNWETDDLGKRQELVNKFLDKLFIVNVDRLDITQEQIENTNMASWRKDQLKKYVVELPPFTMHFIEMYAYGNSTPIKFLYYSFKNESYFTQSFQMTQGTLSIVR